MRTCARVVIEGSGEGCVCWVRGKRLFFSLGQAHDHHEKEDDVYALGCLYLTAMGRRVSG